MEGLRLAGFLSLGGREAQRPRKMQVRARGVEEDEEGAVWRVEKVKEGWSISFTSDRNASRQGAVIEELEVAIVLICRLSGGVITLEGVVGEIILKRLCRRMVGFIEFGCCELGSETQ